MVNYSQFIKIKCVVVGDSDVGKSRLVNSYITYTFPNEPPFLETHSVNVTIDGVPYTLGLFNTAGRYSN
jgi:cell division control protein 42